MRGDMGRIAGMVTGFVGKIAKIGAGIGCLPAE
jgi:hypothetical protein